LLPYPKPFFFKEALKVIGQKNGGRTVITRRYGTHTGGKNPCNEKAGYSRRQLCCNKVGKNPVAACTVRKFQRQSRCTDLIIGE
jgi:hypothetical protein